jgi:adenylylsulfate kinase
MIVQLCGLSGVGKSTISRIVKNKLIKDGYLAEMIDGDEYRRMLCRDLSFSREDRNENIRRLAFVADKLSAHGIIVLISAINPYEEIRNEVTQCYNNVKTVFIDCSIETLIKRDTKGLYARALLADDHPDKVFNLTGVNDNFDIPTNPDLYINSGILSIKESTGKLYDFVVSNLGLISSRYD